MEDDYLEDEEFEPNAITQESPLDEPQEEDRGLYNEHEHTQYGDEDPWLNDNMLASTPLIENQVNKAPTENDWDSSNTLSNENEAAENNQETQEHSRGSFISFTGYGQCSCGCGSFGGHGNICSYCGHPFSAHSRYKK